ncbi:N-acyl-D-amino-acid deacylase family protein [Paraburkholderia caballeronis]|uniref:N-acyl-D-amino-acid deacylase n=1 Tax=Paraburkholderia caballeronis TaxID=416943 RepID=A0A1H7I368_9BURK|nr:D-aminoacylase [Paraburkholderia caballeronis]PXW29281.1 N-acyl-D-amino-acid deacylase [Paraburkholderia caballeronis]PXX04540.1 N-acyl-D-amino-acid deacylase [Paraburkholderia caballeronis]RAK05601.1 N-acyl-D-amino-acid deacylase [Paraburkholderia caballeronis]SEC95067.1 N-acyl-D-amino-acid deacylase [Paraburkholderia caballeronis]SEK55880.1 N-acyl-D-amino-acid deacylase [Paraburkholderia caballeronis]
MHSHPEAADTLIVGAQLYDGSGAPPLERDVALRGGRIVAIGNLSNWLAEQVVEAGGRALAPGFIDVHTHDDTHVIRSPQMLPKISQGVTTVVVGNCGISASPVTLAGDPPDPMNLLGERDAFRYPTFSAYVDAVNAAQPAVNVGALIGHTALRSNHLDSLARAATADEIAAMRAQLEDALAHGALGLSSGLAYASANAAPTEEVMALAEPLAAAGALYTTHMRTEFDAILDAMDEAYRVGRHARVPVVISHLKCAGPSNWGRSTEVLASLEGARGYQPVGCDCYPYSRSSSTLDLKQVTGDIDITITWSTPHPEQAGKLIKDIAADWGVSQQEAAQRLQPAGAVYHNMSEDDVRRILSHPATMVGSDGLPNDPLPHPRLWGAFPRVLGHYARDVALLPLEEAIRKMTSLSARRFGIAQRGEIRIGWHADLVLFDPATVRDTATFDHPQQVADGIDAVWVNGVLSYRDGAATGGRAGRFVPRGAPAGGDAAAF